MGFPEEVTLLAVPGTEQSLPKRRSGEGIQAVKMVHLIITTIAECVCHFLVAKHNV